MIGYRRKFSYLSGLAILVVTYSVIGLMGLAQTGEIPGKGTLKQADGSVTVDGSSADSGASILSGSTISTARGSSAVVSLGKLGRVELAAETTVRLMFTDSVAAVAMIDSPNGRATIITQKTGNATPPEGGKLRVVGEVSVNGTSANSGATVFSDSTVTTAGGSSAVVSLGKLGRVELMENSKMNLKFDSTGTTAMLSQGRVRLSTSSGI